MFKLLGLSVVLSNSQTDSLWREKNMSKIIIGILAILHVYCIQAIVCFITLKLLKELTSKIDSNSKGSYISSVRAAHVLALVLVIYFIPLVALILCMAFESLLLGPAIMLILGSTGFVTKKIILPASESKHIQLAEKYYGEDSAYTKYLIKKQQERYNQE